MTIQEQRLAELKGRIASQVGKEEYSLMKISRRLIECVFRSFDPIFCGGTRSTCSCYYR